MKRLSILLLCVLMLLVGCTKNVENDSTPPESGYSQISQEQAKKMMEDTSGILILDVREMSQFLQNHISGAVLLPANGITEQSAKTVIPNSDSTILVYGESAGQCSAAAEILVTLGYTNVYDFGSSEDWPY